MRPPPKGRQGEIDLTTFPELIELIESGCGDVDFVPVRRRLGPMGVTGCTAPAYRNGTIALSDTVTLTTARDRGERRDRVKPIFIWSPSPVGSTLGSDYCNARISIATQRSNVSRMYDTYSNSDGINCATSKRRTEVTSSDTTRPVSSNS